MADKKVVSEARDIQSWEHTPKRDYPEAIVGGFIRNKKGELLFVSSHKWKNMWSIPGGHVELGERLTDALRREIAEEVGLKVRVTKLLNVQEAIYPKSFVRKAHFIFFDYLCECESEKVKLDKVEIQDYKWVKPEAAMKLKMNEYTRHALELIVMGAEQSIPPKLEKKLLTE